MIGSFSFAQTVVSISLKQLTDPKVTQFGFHVVSYQYILWFYVSVYNVVDMH